MVSRAAPVADDTPRRIVVEATRLFARRGYAGTSVQAIAEAVGVRRQSLLHWYPSKAVLRDAVLNSVLDHWRETVPAVLAAATTGSRRFEGLVGEVMRFFEADPDRARLLLRECLDRPEDLREKLRERLSPWFPLVTEAVRTGQASGRVHPKLDPEVWLVELLLLIVGSFAVDAVVGSLIQAPAEELRARRNVELVRLARASLFRPRPETSPS